MAYVYKHKFTTKGTIVTKGTYITSSACIGGKYER